MTETADDPGPDLYTEAVRILTDAARATTAVGDQVDFADFIAHVLSATAANLGGPDELLAGRPGSWEAELVDSLIEGTMGDDPVDWLQHRTQSLTIPLNVAELIETHPDHDGLLGLEDALDSIQRRYADDPVDERPLSDDRLEALTEELRAIEIRYRVEYRLYADDFEAAIHREANSLGITWPINIDADTDPASRWWETASTHNPNSPYADPDPIATELWETAPPPSNCPTSRSARPDRCDEHRRAATSRRSAQLGSPSR